MSDDNEPAIGEDNSNSDSNNN